MFAARRIALACALLISAFAGRAAAQVDLTPPTGTATVGGTWAWSNKGYVVTFSSATPINAMDVRMTLAVNDHVHAHIFDEATMASLAVGSDVSGTGVDQFYKSNIVFTPLVGHPYVLAFYASNTATPFIRKDTPTYPYTVGNITSTNSRASLNNNNTDNFPDYLGNTWGPYIRVYEGGVAKASANPGTIAFGNQRINTASANQVVTITNVGNANLVLNSAVPNGPYNITGFPLPQTLVPNASTTFNVSFAPTVVGPGNGNLSINSNDPASPLVVTFSGAGIASKATLNPVSINFGNQAVNTVSAASNVTLTNTGQAVLDITNVVVNGPYQQVGLVNGAIQPNAMVAFTVKFAPLVAGAAPGNVTITSDDPASPTVLSLTGVGTAASIAAAPNPVNFGTQLIGGGGASQNVSLTNTGNATLNITALSFGGANPGDFSIALAPPLPAAVAPNSAVNVTVLFKPQGHGARNATLVVTSDAINMGMFAVTLQGVGSGPQIAAAPSPLMFGSANVNSMNSKPLTISNSGDLPLVVSNYTFGGANGADYSSMTAVPFTLVPNGSMPIVVNWKPTTAGPSAANITIASNDPVNPATMVNINGTALAPMVSVSSMTIDFGKVLANTTSSPQQLTVTNTGNGPLTISSVVLGGPDAAQFQFTPGMLPVTLPPNGGMPWSLTFAPAAVGKYNAMLTITSDDPMQMNLVVPVTGEGTSPMVAVDQTTLDFGAQLVGHPSAQRTVKISNSGTAPLTLSAIGLSGPQAADYTIVNPPGLPVTLAPLQAQTVSITLTSAMVGQELGTLLVGSDDPNTPQVKVKLTGSGVSTLLSVSPMTIDFGVIKAPGSGMTKMITITNSGGDPITLLAPKLTGMSASAFMVDSPAGIIMPGEVKMVGAHAMAATAGDLAATVTFAAMDNAIPPGAVMMTAKGVSALIVAMPSTIDFGNVPVGTSSATKQVTVTNQSTTPVQLKSVSADDPTFVVTGADTSSMLAPAMSSTFNVAFAPTAVGAKMGKISITLVGGTGPEQVVMAMGTGTAAASPDMGMGGGGNGNASGCSCSVGARSRTLPPYALLGLLLCGVVAVRRRRR